MSSEIRLLTTCIYISIHIFFAVEKVKKFAEFSDQRVRDLALKVLARFDKILARGKPGPKTKKKGTQL